MARTEPGGKLGTRGAGWEGMNYTVNGKSFGQYFGDAQRYAMNLIRLGARRSRVLANGQCVSAYVRGPSGLAMVAS